MHFATFLMVLTLPQTVVTPSETLFCSEELRGEDKRLVGVAKLEVDKAHRVLSSLLTIWGDGFKAEWSATLEKGAVSLAPYSLDLDSWRLPKETRFPVQVDVAVDGESSGRFQLPAATVQIVDPAEFRQARGTFSARMDAATSPGVQLPKSMKLHNLWSASSIVIKTSDADGVVVDQRTLKTPDWQALRTFSDKAFPVLEQRRKNKGCRPIYAVTVFD